MKLLLWLNVTRDCKICIKKLKVDNVTELETTNHMLSFTVGEKSYDYSFANVAKFQLKEG